MLGKSKKYGQKYLILGLDKLFLSNSINFLIPLHFSK